MFNFKIKLNMVINRNDESFIGFFLGGTRCLGFFACFCSRVFLFWFGLVFF